MSARIYNALLLGGLGRLLPAVAAHFHFYQPAFRQA